MFQCFFFLTFLNIKMLRGTLRLKKEVFQRMFIPHYVSCVMCVECHMSHVTCNLSPVTGQNIFFLHFFIKEKNTDFFCHRTKWCSMLVEGLLSMGPTPSSFMKSFFFKNHQIMTVSINELIKSWLWMCFRYVSESLGPGFLTKFKESDVIHCSSLSAL